jgi:hypothetical protein
MAHRHRAGKNLALAVALVGAVVPAATAGAANETHLASQTPAHRFPNGRSAHAAFSQDRKGASLLTYDSAASDIVAGDSNGVTDVFVVHRARPVQSGG